MVMAFQLQHHDAPRQILGLGPVRNLLRQSPDMTVEHIGVGSIFVEGRLVRDRLHAGVAGHPAIVLPACQMPQPVPMCAETLRQRLAIPAAQIGEAADACRLQRRGRRLPHPPDQPDRPRSEEVLRFRLANHRKTARLVEIRGKLGQKLIVAEPDRAADAKLGFHLL